MKKYIKKFLKYFVVAGVFSLGINLLSLTFSVYMLAIYDRVLSSYSMPTLVTITVAAIFAMIVQGVLENLRSKLLVLLGIDIDMTLSKSVFSEMVKDACRIDRSGYSGGLRDVNLIRNYLAGSGMFALLDLPWAPIFFIFIYMVHPVMGFVALGGAAASIVLGVAQDFMTRKKLESANAMNLQSNSYSSICLRNCESVRAMGMLSGVESKWDAMNNQVIDLQTEASSSAGFLQSLARGIRTSMQVIIYGVGAYLTLKNECTAGVMISSSIIMGRALAPIDQGMATWKQSLEAWSAYKRLDALITRMKTEESMVLPDPAGKLDVESASLVVKNQYILKNISFSLEPGEIMALIGPSAAGKSSLSRVLLGIWPSMGGKVRLDGADMFQWDQEHLGRFIGYLPQDVELLPGTISQNISRFGDVDPEEVIKAAKKAGVHDLILHLPSGYDTLIGGGPDSVVLSGGQRQRIALARAIYGNPKFIVLDEPNSSLDETGEAALMNVIHQLKQDKVTTIIVTHKPGILVAVDKILFLQYGQVARFGNRSDFFQPVATGQIPHQNIQSPVVKREAVN